MTTYPEAFDTDLELPRATDDVSELSVDYINSLRDAVIAIQKVIGLAPQGLKSSLTERVNISIDSNGRIKKAALDGIGLVTLPITNIHVGPTAGILESKLALDYGTAYLKNLMDSMRIDMQGMLSGLAINTDAANSHYLGIGNFHDGYHIKINSVGNFGVAGLEATTIGGAVNEIGSYLLSGDGTIEPHIDLDLPSTVKHVASTISVDSSNFTTIDRTATNVQAALDGIDSSSAVFGASHLDTFHASGILKEISSGTYYNPNRLLVGPIKGAYFSEGTSIVAIPGITSFSSLNIRTGDILRIHEHASDAVDIVDAGTYQIRAVGPLEDADTLGDLPTLEEDEVAIFHTFIESRATDDEVWVSIYKPASETSESAPLACTVRNNETIVDTISILQPNAARVVSIGLNGAILNSDGYEIHIKAGIGNGVIREVRVPNLNRERLGTNQADPVNSKTIAERINAYLSDPDLGHHFPVTAYRIGNELAIAHNWVGQDYTLTIEDGYTGDFALGFDAYGANVLGQELVGSEGHDFIINGLSCDTVRTLFDGYATITEDSDTLILWSDGQMINPLRYGIKAGSVMHVSGHHTHEANGSYTLLAANEATVSVFTAEKIPCSLSPSTTFNVKFTDADVPLTPLFSTEYDRGLVQIHIDSSGKTMLHQRMTYGTNLGAGIEVINISNGFAEGATTIVVGFDGDMIVFNLMDDTLYGETIEVHETFRGTFKLYHPNGLDYLVFKVSSSVISSGIETVYVNAPIPEDEAILLCTAHFDSGLSVDNLIDNRLFGNVSVNQVRDDFIEIYSQQPVKDLRSDGVVRGFDILNAMFWDSISNMQAVPLRGGIAYVNGVRVAVETQKVTIQSYDPDGDLVAQTRKLIAINEFGSIQVINDELGEVLTDGYNASAAFGRMLPLYYVDIVAGGIEKVIDVRRFINNLDDKIEIVVDETNNVVGNFRTLEGALLFADKYPGREKLTIRIINTAYIDSPITIPDGVSIIGGAPYGGESKHQIVNYAVESEHYFITFSGNNRLENIEIISPLVNLSGSLAYINGPNVNVEYCLFRFGEEITTNSEDFAIELGQNATYNIRIVNNKIDNVYSGIISNYGTEDLLIKNNIITNVSGTGGNAYGIRVGSGARSVKNIVIEDNSIRIPSIASGTDLRGISIDIAYDMDIVRLARNNIIHEAQNTMTNGIRVDIIDGYTGVIDNLFISDNVIDGIKLDDNYVYGIYVANTNQTVIDGNKLKNVGVDDDNRTDTAIIKVASTFGFAEVTNNVLKDCNILRGIEVETQDQNCRVAISGNTVENIGKNAHYIRGSSAGSLISNNILVGPGKIGIRWNGSGSTITGNHLSRPNTLAIGDIEDDYAFEEYAIYAPTSDVDITNNTITGMIFDYGSIGISNGGASRNRLKILDNTISGSLMRYIIELYGSDHIVNNNKLSNDAIKLNDATQGILLQSVTNSLFMGNSIRGAITAGFYSTYTPAMNLTIVNNAVIAETLINGSILLNGTTEDCVIMGNRFPDGSVMDNVIGSTPAIGDYNTNLIGVNYGLQDVRGIHACHGVTAYDSAGAADYSEYPHWLFKDTNDYWEVNSENTNEARHLYFPITDLPNGAKLDSVQIQGKMPTSGGGTLQAQLFKRSVKTAGLTVTAISTLKDMSSATGEFGNGLDIGLVEVSTSGGEVINYAESNYYLEIIHMGLTPTDPENIRVYGVTINFTY